MSILDRRALPVQYRVMSDGGRKMRRDARWRLVAAVVVGLVLVALGAVAAPAAPTILYVDGSNPSCSDGGAGSAAQPFCTLAKGAGVALAGQTVLVAGGSYAGGVSVGHSGVAGSPVTLRAASGATVTVSGGVHGFTVSSKAYVTIEGFEVTGTSGTGIQVTGSSHVTISGNHVSFAGHPVSSQTRQGIQLSNTSDSLVSGNVTDHNSEAGIQLTNGSTRDTVAGNDSFANARGYTRAAPGIDLRAPGNTAIGNLAHGNEDSGIQSYTGGSGGLIVDNLTYGNGDHGIDDLNVPGQRIIGNTVYGNVAAGINVEGSSPDATVENNISVDNGIASPRTHSDIRIDPNSTSGTTVDYNLTFLTQPDTLYVWGSSSYTSLAAFQAATGQGAHDRQANPRWVSVAGHDFHLAAGSPAIDSANAGVGGQQASDLEGRSRVDDPTTANSGAGPRAFDDRGAYEFQPGGGGQVDNPPAAALTVTPSSGTAPLGVTADAGASSDPDATPIASYTFDFGDGTTVGPQRGATASHIYGSAGSWQVTVTVADTAGKTATATATVTVASGGGGGGGGSNLVGNPGFESGTGGWSGTGLAQVAGGHGGGFSARLENTGSSAISCTLNDSPNWVATTAAGGYTASMWLRADSPGATVKLRLREYNGATLVGSATTSATLGTAWQQVSVAYTPGVGGASSLDLNAYVSSAPTGVCFYADDVSLTLG